MDIVFLIASTLNGWFCMENASENNWNASKAVRVSKNGRTHKSVALNVFRADGFQNAIMLNGVAGTD